MLENIVMTVAWVWGVNCLFSPGMLLGESAALLRKVLPRFFTKPLFDCPPCMASVHGTLAYLYLFNSWHPGQWIVFCVAVCGVNFILKLNLFE